MQPFAAKAYRLEDGEWMIDDDVWMRIIFSPVQNVKADIYAARGRRLQGTYVLRRLG